MGILNLHKFLERCASKNNLSSMRGEIVGVDAMCWLHRGSIASAWELLTGRDTDKFLRFFVKMLVMCNMCGVKPIIVFDGASLPAKAKEETERRARRAENSMKAKAEIESRKITSYGQVDNKLRSMIVQSVSISGDMITRTMSVLRRLNVDFVVAPYEADAQLAYMYKQGLVSGVVSEDSDLLAFGCHRLLSKMDINGDFTDVRLDWAFKGADCPLKPCNLGELGKLESWSEAMFVDLCILSGSDYKLGKISGIGIKKAFGLLNKYRSINRIVEVISRDKKWSGEDKSKFLEDFLWAKTAFERHRVFDVKTYMCVPINENNRLEETDDMIVGPAIEMNQVKLILTGEIEAKTGFKRIFLDKLPPGVLGVYNASILPRPNKIISESVACNEVSKEYEQLEQKLVEQFEQMLQYKKENVNIAKFNYLSKLEGMILSSSAVTHTSQNPTDEFENLEELLELDLHAQETQDVDLINLLEEDSEDNQDDARKFVDNTGISKVKNPFAKAVNQENKKPRPNPGLASAMPLLKSEKTRISLGSVSTVNEALDQRRLSTGSAGNRRESFVSTRVLKLKSPTGKKFFARRQS